MSSNPITIIAFFVLLFVVMWSYERLAKRVVEKLFGVKVYLEKGRRDSMNWHVVGTKGMGQSLLIHALRIVGGILALGLVALLTFGVDKFIVPLVSK
ncbi:MAG: hypothetical protein K8I60_00885, partial [Anaerolineae bacterium]|nr:hypothetical protein [Anaerolineae bacterium]